MGKFGRSGTGWRGSGGMAFFRQLGRPVARQYASPKLCHHRLRSGGADFIGRQEAVAVRDIMVIVVMLV